MYFIIIIDCWKSRQKKCRRYDFNAVKIIISSSLYLRTVTVSKENILKNHDSNNVSVEEIQQDADISSLFNNSLVIVNQATAEDGR